MKERSMPKTKKEELGHLYYSKDSLFCKRKNIFEKVLDIVRV